ncbi:MAG: oligosaccharide flippase family protein [Candidatus Edwardsbacteria bacterium]|jgi:O-antigen/teichoic acid export membrane protein/SAM-dependent methyltransferase|nr:oligosaccharide flippase family protein [Candidatus Edwardsbacteria bacterium]
MSLKQQTIDGLAWSVTENVASLGIQFIVGIILARLLSPGEFGLIGMVTVFVAVSLIVIDGGFSHSLIRKTSCTQEDYSTVFYFNLAGSAVAYLALYVLAGPVSVFFHEPRLVPIVRVVAVGLVIGSLGIIHRTILVKRIDFRTQTTISVIAAAASGAVAIGMAYRGFGVWSLVWKAITATALSTVLLWAWTRWQPLPAFSLSAFKEHFRFGYKLLFTNLINTVYQNIYYLLIGRYFSAAQLGYYTKAEEFSNLPSSNITTVVQRVSYPVLSQLQDEPHKLKAGFQRIIKNTMFISFISMMGLAAVAQPLVTTLIGEQWATSAVYLQLLCFSAMLYPLHALNLNVLHVKGRSDLSLRIEIVKKLLVIPIILAAMAMGIKAMLAGLIAISFGAFFLNGYYSGKLIRYGAREQIADILPSFVIGAVVSAVLFLETRFINAGRPLLLAVQLASGAALLVAISETVRNPEYLEMKGIARSFMMRMGEKLRSRLRPYVPVAVLKDVAALFGRRRFYCPVCRRRVRGFERLPDAYFRQWMKHRYVHSIFNGETINILAYACPSCGASDRDRLSALYLDAYLAGKELQLLEMAPSRPLAALIRSHRGVRHRTADLHMPGVDDTVDITDMSIYPDGNYDFIICSHILEHVEDDVKAMRELYRVLSPGGRAILMVPIQLGLERDYQVGGPLTAAERWHHYGQDDHVRTYSKPGFTAKVQSVGFTIEELAVDHFGRQQFDRCGIHEGSVLYVASKP